MILGTYEATVGNVQDLTYDLKEIEDLNQQVSDLVERAVAMKAGAKLDETKAIIDEFMDAVHAATSDTIGAQLTVYKDELDDVPERVAEVGGGVMAHTPGPWWTNHNDSTDSGIFPKGRMDGYQIATVKCGDNYDLPLNELNGNARLIAAAPELLEALQAMCSWEECDDLLSWARICSQARTAIAKATGDA